MSRPLCFTHELAERHAAQMRHRSCRVRFSHYGVTRAGDDEMAAADKTPPLSLSCLPSPLVTPAAAAEADISKRLAKMHHRFASMLVL